MGREIGFEFYKLQNNKLIEANVIKDKYGCREEKVNYLFICGRCKATDIFADIFLSKDPNYFKNPDLLSPEEKFTPYILLNHPELDNFEDHQKDKNNHGWFKKLFYIGIDDFKNNFDFNETEREHNEKVNYYTNEMLLKRDEIKELRKYQQNAKTKAAFEGFSEEIKALKEEIDTLREERDYIMDDDYDFNHYKWIKEDIEIVENLIREDADLIVLAFYSE